MSTLHPLTFTFGGYTEKMRFAANPMNYDVILCKKWTSNHSAVTHCCTIEIKFEHKGKTHTIVAREPRNHSIVSVNEITEDNDQNYPLYAVSLRKIPQTNQEISKKNLLQMLREYKVVFLKKLPKGLPPKHALNFIIALKEGSTPQKNRLHRMSSAELLKTQSSDLIDIELRRHSSGPWGAPVLFLSKKGGALRLCVAYRALNRLSVTSSYPSPHWRRYGSAIHGQLFRQDRRLPSDPTRWRVYSIDNIPTRYAHFEFQVLPFGFKNA